MQRAFLSVALHHRRCAAEFEVLAGRVDAKNWKTSLYLEEPEGSKRTTLKAFLDCFPKGYFPDGYLKWKAAAITPASKKNDAAPSTAKSAPKATPPTAPSKPVAVKAVRTAKPPAEKPQAAPKTKPPAEEPPSKPVEAKAVKVAPKTSKPVAANKGKFVDAAVGEKRARDDEEFDLDELLRSHGLAQTVKLAAVIRDSLKESYYEAMNASSPYGVDKAVFEGAFSKAYDASIDYKHNKEAATKLYDQILDFMNVRST